MAGNIRMVEDRKESDTIYMLPEILSSSVNYPSADIFSLCLTLYELASPFGLEIPIEGLTWYQLRHGVHL